MTQVRLITVGQEVIVDTAEGPVVAKVEKVSQRNWSRVGVASAPSGRMFLKQFVDRQCKIRADHLAQERDGLALLATSPRLRATQLIATIDDRATLVFRWEDLTAVDDLLRSVDSASFDRCWSKLILPSLGVLLDELVAAAARGEPVAHEKVRGYPSVAEAVVLKGLDIRNLGVGPASPTRHLAIFDPGKPYRGPVEEAAAKLLVSVGLLNWGRPVNRFRSGVPGQLLEGAVAQIGPRSSWDAISVELGRQRRMRMADVPTGSGIEHLARRWMPRWLGDRYLRDLEEWLEQRFR